MCTHPKAYKDSLNWEQLDAWAEASSTDPWKTRILDSCHRFRASKIGDRRVCANAREG